MGISCSKEYTLHVDAGASDLLAYWKCEEALGASALIDEVASREFTATNELVAQEPGKLGQATRIGGDFINNWEFWTDNSLPTSTYDLSAGDFTFRCWVIPVYDAGDYVIFDGGAFHPWSLWWRNWDGVNDTYLTFEVKATGAPGDMECWVPASAGSWLHVVGWYERGVGAGLRINSLNVDTFAETALMPSANQSLYMGGMTVGQVSIDEIALWIRKLTTVEIAYDYNSGTGRTYPDVPGANLP